ncbi:2-hydroxyacid dehydrogenase [Ruania zhangjianzhongii]|uniref:2-hydroxyacid dehydrogenase n=1 Tax=Ruania zhangjianzhongii TaxID=2603206 RepID=UPI0011C8A5B5|nr:2-hydroxyacid dehydrogenase [Ruania zhangjianzhongii]
MHVVVADRALQRFRDELEAPLPGATFTYCDPGDESGLRSALAAAEVLVSGTLTAELAQSAPALRLVHAAGAGTDGIAFAALGSGVMVANVFEHEDSIAEHVLMVALALARDLLPADAHLRRGRWLNAAVDDSLGLNRTLNGRTLGLIGYGHIGQAVARLAHLFGMRVQAIRSSPGPTPAPLTFLGGPADLARILRESDVVVVTVPLSDATRGLIGSEELAMMRPTAHLINVARGPIVDEQALYRALVAGTIAGAGLDVWYAAPPPAAARRLPATAPFGDLDNVILTPHYSGVTEDTFRRRAREIGANIARLAAGEEIHHRIV